MCLLKTVKLNRLMIVDVWWSDDEETRHVYSPPSSSDTSDKINDQVHAYLQISKDFCERNKREFVFHTYVQVEILFDHHYQYLHQFLLLINVPWVRRNPPRIHQFYYVYIYVILIWYYIFPLWVSDVIMFIMLILLSRRKKMIEARW